MSYTCVEIPLFVDTPNYTISVPLDETEYLLRFDYNGRLDRWYVHLYTANGTPLRVGMKVVCNWDVLRRTCAPRPRGALLFVDQSNPNGEAPGYAELGRRVRLVYLTPDLVPPPPVTEPVPGV